MNSEAEQTIVVNKNRKEAERKENLEKPKGAKTKY
jgi:hypothetical protein